MTREHMKSYSTSLVIREMSVKATLRYHLTLVRVSNIKKSTSNKSWGGCALLVEMWIGAATVENSMEISLKTRNKTTT